MKEKGEEQVGGAAGAGRGAGKERDAGAGEIGASGKHVSAITASYL
jgi:hypothetical protein